MRNGFAFGMIKDCSRNLFFGNQKKKSIFESITVRLRDYRAQKLNREIFESITFLRNLASIDKGREYSSDTIIEKLSEHEGLLRPIFIKMLNLLRLNQPKEAAELFSKSVGTQAGRDFAVLLIKWDRMEPGELIETLLSYEKSMKAIRITSQKRKDEIVSELIYFPVVVNILVIFINFIYIAYFIEQKEMLMMIM
ncbi:MAG: hypothetical protein PHN73_01210 [Eubacteriales bacterium]|nr:hypothetical protein [Eubacteriales bacterium]